MKIETLTVNGVRYTISDPEAVKLTDENIIQKLKDAVLAALPDGDEVAY
ncbi:MAG: hypothetical protein J6C41_03330 [Oscillospiraceae bacterium]|nr:hypothetical protein [Oscillospiraceae bacterium]